MTNQERETDETRWDAPQEKGSLHETIAISSTSESAVAQGPDFRDLPQMFGRYELQEAIGEGGMGSVYLAKDTQLNRKVALKFPKFAQSNVSKLIERFHREAQAAATLSHPNICPIYDAGEIDGQNYIAMGYVQGRPLTEFIRQAHLPAPRSVVVTIRKIALAIQEAHSHRLVHRDLKPANIMIDHRNEPIVMDFGLACRPDEAETSERVALDETRQDARLTQDGTILGSPAYMAPEQLQAKVGNIGPSCDIYALGVMMFELLTGQLPFQGTGSIMSIIREVYSKETPDAHKIRPEVDANLGAIGRKAMAKKPEDRYESMQSFAAALTNYLKTSPGDGGPTPRLQSASHAKTDSAELIRAREQYELAQSLCKTGQFAAAVSILEKMTTITDATATQFVDWAKKELPKAQTKAQDTQPDIDATVAMPALDEDLWKDELQAPAATDSTGAAGLGSPLYPQAHSSPSWMPWVIGGAVGALIFMVLLIVVGMLSRSLYDDPEPDSPDSTTGEVVKPDSPKPGPPTASPQAKQPDKTAAKPKPPGAESAGTGRPGLERELQRLRELDKNNDGKLSVEELPAIWKPIFPAADTNMDGGLDAKEVRAMLGKLAARPRNQRPGGFPPVRPGKAGPGKPGIGKPGQGRRGPLGPNGPNSLPPGPGLPGPTSGPTSGPGSLGPGSLGPPGAAPPVGAPGPSAPNTGAKTPQPPAPKS